MPRIHAKTMSEEELSQDHILAIGLVAAEWGYVESTIEALIWALAGIDELKGYSITTHIGNVTRMDIINTLTTETIKDNELKTEITNAMKEYEMLREQRNKIIHSIWLIDKPSFRQGSPSKPPQSIHIKAKGKIEFKVRTQTPEEMREIAKQMTSLTVKITHLIYRTHTHAASLGIRV